MVGIPAAALQHQEAQVTQPAVHNAGSSALVASDRQSRIISQRHGSTSQQHVLPASNIPSASQHSAKYTTNASTSFACANGFRQSVHLTVSLAVAWWIGAAWLQTSHHHICVCAHVDKLIMHDVSAWHVLKRHGRHFPGQW